MKKTGVFMISFILLVLITGILKEQLFFHSKYRNLTADICQSEEFRRMDLSKKAIEELWILKNKGYSPGSILSVFLPWYRFKTPPVISWTYKDYQEAEKSFYIYRRELFWDFSKIMCAIWDDLVCFPTSESVSYENSWLAERSYDGPRTHEGCDLMPKENIRDFYPIFSITDGVVEKVGWLKKGGYRIGIRSKHGGYFYYAHFSSYAKEWKAGDVINAGELLGYMGDSGYGDEGTTGKFAVHLHLGLYIDTPAQKEISVNPYWILRYLELSETMKPL